jgi:hypothetical protein
MDKLPVLTAIAVMVFGAPAFGQLAPPAAVTTAPPIVVPPTSILTPRGPALITGTPGGPQSVMIPGSPIPGMLLNNGNGTSTIMIPGGTSQVAPTPR